MDGKGLVTPLDISAEDVEISVDECSLTTLAVRYKYKDTVFMTRVSEVPPVSACLEGGQFGGGKFTLVLGILGTVLLVLVILVLCMRMMKKKKTRNTGGLLANRVDVLPERNAMPNIN